MITVYTKDNCPACVQFKADLQKNNQEYVEINIGRDISREDFITQYPGVRSVPFVVNEAYEKKE